MQRSEKGYQQIIESFVKANYGEDELRDPSWDIAALAKTLATARLHKADNKDYLQLQHEAGHDVPKVIRYTQGGWDFIEAYGAVMGMTLEQTANFMLIRELTDLLKNDCLGNAVREMALAKKLARKKK